MPILGGGDGNNDVVNSPGDSPSSPSLEHGAECVVGDVGATDQRANNDATTTKQDHHLSSCGSHSSLRSRRKSQPGLAKPVDPQLVEVRHVHVFEAAFLYRAWNKGTNKQANKQQQSQVNNITKATHAGQRKA
eukprot:m.300679 g.300679  ORF g.300679 m.300679 type:complete len:133 (-) comp19558_c0_seq16:64-462(-)